MIKDIPEYVDEALKDTKVCPMIMEDIQADPVISKEFIVQKTIKQLLRERFTKECISQKLFNIIQNKLTNKTNS